MDVPLNVDVLCTDGPVGRSTHLIFDPLSMRVTHVVVRKRHFPHTDHLVPLHLVAEAGPDLIRLGCGTRDVVSLDQFTEIHYIEVTPSDFDDPRGPILMWPYVVPEEPEFVSVDEERVPPGELAVRRGERVRDSNGARVGSVDELLVNPEDGHVTHLVLREGHPWGRKDVTIPVSQIERIEEAVHLRLDSRQIAALPATPIHRHWWS